MTEPTEPKVSYPGVYLEEEGQSGHTIDGVPTTPTTAPSRWMQRVAAGGIAAAAVSALRFVVRRRRRRP